MCSHPSFGSAFTGLWSSGKLLFMLYGLHQAREHEFYRATALMILKHRHWVGWGEGYRGQLECLEWTSEVGISADPAVMGKHVEPSISSEFEGAQHPASGSSTENKTNDRCFFWLQCSWCLSVHSFLALRHAELKKTCGLQELTADYISTAWLFDFLFRTELQISVMN